MLCAGISATTVRAYHRTGIRKKCFIFPELTPLFCQERETLNPKITLIIEQVFPRIIDHHIRTRSSVQSALESLDRYRTMGFQAIRNLSEDEREENRKALDDAHAAAVRRLEEFHDQEMELTKFSAGSGSTDAS